MEEVVPKAARSRMQFCKGVAFCSSVALGAYLAVGKNMAVDEVTREALTACNNSVSASNKFKEAYHEH